MEIHFFANAAGDTRFQNTANCNRYRLLQVRKTNTKLYRGERAVDIDVPGYLSEPFSDNAVLEHGVGTHLTPADDRDKIWQGRVVRASTVALYDTPYVSDGFGVEGKDMQVEFETCVVCERDHSFDSLLSCGRWGYKREYMGGTTGWAEPELLPMQCLLEPSQQVKQTLDESNKVQYAYWLQWR